MRTSENYLTALSLANEIWRKDALSEKEAKKINKNVSPLGIFFNRQIIVMIVTG